ncbi:IS21-like element helper ATPase IstB [Streptomyces sp. NPDC090077]|uniref:IS21-like element helper ATPase IstB n=1 Tax=Streptomyces sp. NPDC090077 TaxID=3365938 RepID=UPI00380298D5
MSQVFTGASGAAAEVGAVTTSHGTGSVAPTVRTRTVRIAWVPTASFAAAMIRELIRRSWVAYAGESGRRSSCPVSAWKATAWTDGELRGEGGRDVRPLVQEAEHPRVGGEHAHFPQVKTLEDFNLDHLPSLRRDVLAHLATGTFVAKAENVILLGPPGIGKAHLAIGLGAKATQAGYSVLFDTASNGIARLATAHQAGRLEAELKKIRRYKLIIIDEVGYIPFDQDAANLFFQLIASRYEQGSVMATSNLPFGRWGETFSDDVVAAAMIDRLVHHAEVLTLTGDSYRTRQLRELLNKENGAGRRYFTAPTSNTTADRRPARAEPVQPGPSERPPRLRRRSESAGVRRSSTTAQQSERGRPASP